MLGIELSLDRPVDEAVDLALVAEDEGFDAVLGSCHYNNRDPFVTASRIAAATETVRVGPAAANPYETHPVALASRVATLAEVSDGRGSCPEAEKAADEVLALPVSHELSDEETACAARAVREFYGRSE